MVNLPTTPLSSGTPVRIPPKCQEHEEVAQASIVEPSTGMLMGAASSLGQRSTLEENLRLAGVCSSPNTRARSVTLARSRSKTRTTVSSSMAAPISAHPLTRCVFRARCTGMRFRVAQLAKYNHPLPHKQPVPDKCQVSTRSSGAAQASYASRTPHCRQRK